MKVNRYNAEITDVTMPVPSCPDWNVSQLSRHVEGGLRWAREIVANRASEPPPDTALRDLSEADPTARIRCRVPGDGGAAFYARRFTHETAVHRADAALAFGVPLTLAADVASDGVEEWLELGSLPFHFEVHPWMRELLGPGRIIGLDATDTADQWLLDLTGEAITWRRSDGPTAATLRGPVTDLLLMLYR